MNKFGNFYKIEEFGFEKGKPVRRRLQMLDHIFYSDKDSGKKYDVLDIGCAEAMVGKLYGEHFNSYDGVDQNSERLVTADKVLNKYITCPYSLKNFDFSTKSGLEEFDTEKNLNQYDVVLYLEVQHHILKRAQPHIKNAMRQKVLSYLLNMSSDWFAIRTFFSGDKDSFKNINEHGFDLYFEEPFIAEDQGDGFIFRKRK